jgi:hypothetical protein
VTASFSMLAHYDAKQIVSFGVPIMPEVTFHVPRRALDECLREWYLMDFDTQDATFDKVCTIVSHYASNEPKDDKQDEDMMEAVQAWFAHQLLYADGEKHLRPGLSRDEFIEWCAAQ